ncbi:MAG: hypothetical protein M1355_00990 [Patescibacteria group bacterium]|nr:hypothetical protein [Patescibacteria group bacterium]MCL5093699.1 hypothetical protein [Patescibacteria group bacterium]
MLIKLSMKACPNKEQVEEIMLGVDRNIRSLIVKLNSLPFFISDYSCGGHIKPKIGLYHSGFSFYLDAKNPRSNIFLDDLKSMLAGFSFIALEDGIMSSEDRPNYELEFEWLSYYQMGLKPKTSEEIRLQEGRFDVSLQGMDSIDKLKAIGKKGSRLFFQGLYDETYGRFNRAFELLADFWLTKLRIVVPPEYTPPKKAREEGKGADPWYFSY